MIREEIYERLTTVFRDFFDDDTIEISDNTTAEDIDEWDSYEHVNLIISVEEEFGIKIPMSKVSDMQNVGEMVSIIMEQLDK